MALEIGQALRSTEEIRELIRHLAAENAGWGASPGSSRSRIPYAALEWLRRNITSVPMRLMFGMQNRAYSVPVIACERRGIRRSLRPSDADFNSIRQCISHAPADDEVRLHISGRSCRRIRQPALRRALIKRVMGFRFGQEMVLFTN